MAGLLLLLLLVLLMLLPLAHAGGGGWRWGRCKQTPVRSEQQSLQQQL